MDMIPRNDYGERCQFDAYCKLVLYHEAIDYLREMQRHRDRELSFSDLPQMEMDKLCVVDHYPSDRFTFSSHGYDLHIENELVADAFAGLPAQEQSILILHFVLDLPDQEVGRLVGKELAEKIKKLRSEIEKQSSRSMTTDMFIGLVRKYTRARKLTPRMLNELIEKIEVFNAEKIDGVWEQRLRIHYNCVGTIEIPTVLPLPIPEVSVNTRKGVVVNYAPCELAV